MPSRAVELSTDICELELHDLSIRAAVELNAIVSFGRAV
jgi:hypothetical protein